MFDVCCKHCWKISGAHSLEGCEDLPLLEMRAEANYAEVELRRTWNRLGFLARRVIKTRQRSVRSDIELMINVVKRNEYDIRMRVARF